MAGDDDKADKSTTAIIIVATVAICFVLLMMCLCWYGERRRRLKLLLARQIQIAEQAREREAAARAEERSRGPPPPVPPPPSPRAMAALDESQLCKICFEREREIVFDPCHHCVACDYCSKMLIYHKMPCPICRTDITAATSHLSSNRRFSYREGQSITYREVVNNTPDCPASPAPTPNVSPGEARQMVGSGEILSPGSAPTSDRRSVSFREDHNITYREPPPPTPPESPPLPAPYREQDHVVPVTAELAAIM
eukprot:NODE_5558_length_933_cov_39.744444_g5335_i0.p1 GENE.NODE_5558_length_933_cov_39.744444_g5335_i0~~NODE_5558_length_933_cov_39.744444_g5335_i0.p1  ORF type:complete len:253 (-),score=33.48 NODE_5558_length_933_cov_39.744444_g5335_i0:19-777(-)